MREDHLFFKFNFHVVPIFEENGIFMLGVFFVQSVCGDRNNSFYQKYALLNRLPINFQKSNFEICSKCSGLIL